MQSSDSSNSSSISSDTVILGRYRILSLQGKGAQAELYLADDLQLERSVAVKIVNRTLDEKASKRLKSEAKILSGLKHPNIVKFYAMGELSDGRQAIIMEEVKGLSLAEILASQKKLNYEEFLSIFTQVLNALKYLHEQKVLHLDLKPANILLVGSDKNRNSAGALFEVKIVDFGISKIFDPLSQEESLSAAEFLGTAAYMSPEQCRGDKLDYRSDIYSLACLMYESLSSEPPFQGSNELELMYKHIRDKASVLKAPKKLAELVARGLEKDPDKRFSSIAEMQNHMPKPDEVGESKHGKIRVLLLLAVPILILMTLAATFIKPQKLHFELKEKKNSVSRLSLNSASYAIEKAAALGSSPEAIEIYTKVSRMKGKKNLEYRRSALHALSGYYYLLQDVPRAKLCIKKLLSTENQSTDDQNSNLQNEVATYLTLANVNNLEKDFDSAENSYRSAIKAAKSLPESDRREQLLNQALINQCNGEIAHKRFDLAELSAKETLAQMQNMPERIWQGPIWIQANIHLACIYAHQRKKSELLKVVKELKDFAKSEDQKRPAGEKSALSATKSPLCSILSLSLCSLASTCIDEREYDLAEQLLNESDKLNTPEDESGYKAEVLRQIHSGRLYILKHEFIKARASLVEALKIIEADRKNLSYHLLFDLAADFKSIEEIALAEKCYLLAKERYRNNKIQNTLDISADLHLARLYAQSKRLDKAKELLLAKIPEMKNRNMKPVDISAAEKLLSSVESAIKKCPASKAGGKN
ncbi:MAG: serine/threonine protein kinase [Candidatus Obscuribacterales bacterium]|nr:serine/threonine protein kinase [Candidatus Obscuribacterales bacterium]